MKEKVLYFSFPILALQLCYFDYLQEGFVEPLYFAITLRPIWDAFLSANCQVLRNPSNSREACGGPFSLLRASCKPCVQNMLSKHLITVPALVLVRKAIYGHFE